MANLRSIKEKFKKAAALVVSAPLTMASTTALAAGEGTAATAVGLALGPVTFAQPWMLLGLASLPLLWWLMRSTPPKPKEEEFPAIQLLFNLKSEDQEPARMPLWQRLLRLSAAALVVAGLSQPMLTPDQPLEGDGPLVLVVDDGWASAANWTDRTEKMNNLIDRAESEGHQVMIVPTAPSGIDGAVDASEFMDPAAARHMIDNMEPQPWPVDRVASRHALEHVQTDGKASVVWLSNGLDDDGALMLASRLEELGSLMVLENDAEHSPLLLSEIDAEKDKLTVSIKRPRALVDQKVTVTARDEAGNALGQVETNFNVGETETEAVFDNLPLELRNQVTRVSIDGENSAGATVLLDERWRRRPVGLVAAETTDSVQHLLNGASYVERALDPYVDLRQGDVDDLMKRPLSVMVMTDEAMVNQEESKEIDQWVRGGGTLLRFAGPHLAAQPKDDLLPVEVRPGIRHIGDSLSGQEDGGLREFPKDSPFYGIEVPDNVTIKQQVLAQPGPDLQQKTWALLDDVSPLVTAEQRGSGWVVLVHTSADARWSNLPLSGLFVDMMRAVVAHSQGVSGGPDGPESDLPPAKLMDGKGQYSSPPATARPLTKKAAEDGDISPQHPPGFYGKENIRYAHNLSAAVSDLKPLPDMPLDSKRGTYEETLKHNDFTGPLLTGAFSLMLLDLLVLLGQQGAFSRSRRREQDVKPLASNLPSPNDITPKGL